MRPFAIFSKTRLSFNELADVLLWSFGFRVARNSSIEAAVNGGFEYSVLGWADESITPTVIENGGGK